MLGTGDFLFGILRHLQTNSEAAWEADDQCEAPAECIAPTWLSQVDFKEPFETRPLKAFGTMAAAR